MSRLLNSLSHFGLSHRARDHVSDITSKELSPGYATQCNELWLFGKQHAKLQILNFKFMRKNGELYFFINVRFVKQYWALPLSLQYLGLSFPIFKYCIICRLHQSIFHYQLFYLEIHMDYMEFPNIHTPFTIAYRFSYRDLKKMANILRRALSIVLFFDSGLMKFVR